MTPRCVPVWSLIAVSTRASTRFYLGEGGESLRAALGARVAVSGMGARRGLGHAVAAFDQHRAGAASVPLLFRVLHSHPIHRRRNPRPTERRTIWLPPRAPVGEARGELPRRVYHS